MYLYIHMTSLVAGYFPDHKVCAKLDLRTHHVSSGSWAAEAGMENSGLQKKRQTNSSTATQNISKIAKMEGDLNLQMLNFEVFPFVGCWLHNENAFAREQETEVYRHYSQWIYDCHQLHVQWKFWELTLFLIAAKKSVRKGLRK